MEDVTVTILVLDTFLMAEITLESYFWAMYFCSSRTKSRKCCFLSWMTIKLLKNNPNSGNNSTSPKTMGPQLTSALSAPILYYPALSILHRGCNNMPFFLTMPIVHLD